jgi:hypothetical protein
MYTSGLRLMSCAFLTPLFLIHRRLFQQVMGKHPAGGLFFIFRAYTNCDCKRRLAPVAPHAPPVQRFPLRHHYDPVSVLDHRQTMGNDQHDVTRREFGQLLLDRPLRLDIERRGRFVQNQNRRVLQEHAGTPATSSSRRTASSLSLRLPCPCPAPARG